MSSPFTVLPIRQHQSQTLTFTLVLTPASKKAKIVPVLTGGPNAHFYLTCMNMNLRQSLNAFFLPLPPRQCEGPTWVGRFVIQDMQ